MAYVTTRLGEHTTRLQAAVKQLAAVHKRQRHAQTPATKPQKSPKNQQPQRLPPPDPAPPRPSKPPDAQPPHSLTNDVLNAPTQSRPRQYMRLNALPTHAETPTASDTEKLHAPPIGDLRSAPYVTPRHKLQPPLTGPSLTKPLETPPEPKKPHGTPSKNRQRPRRSSRT